MRLGQTSTWRWALVIAASACLVSFRSDQAIEIVVRRTGAFGTPVLR